MEYTPAWIYAKLLDYYGSPAWWPGDPYEIMAGAVLVQNTAWGNVEQSIRNFGGRLSPGYVESLPAEELVGLIRPSGFFNAKAACLKAVTAWYQQYGYSVEKVRRQPLEKMRSELLSIKGVGQETADAILLYTFRFPAFVIDAYTKRFAQRLPLRTALDYAALQAYFPGGIDGDADLFGGYHILFLEHGKTHCKKRPRCGGCPFEKECGYAKEQKK